MNVSCLCRQTRLFQRGPGWSWMVGWWDAGGTWYEACEVVRTNNFSKNIVDLCPYCSPLKCCSSWYLVVSHFFQGGRLSRIGGTIGNTAEGACWSSDLLHSLAGHNPPEKAKVEKSNVSQLVQFERAEGILYTPAKSRNRKNMSQRGKEKSSTHHLFLGLHFGGI